MTALHIAVYWNYLDLVELLVERGAELDVQNRRGRTPLRIAESFGYEEVAKYLADKMGAIVEQPEVVRSPKRINTKDPLQVTAPITFDAA
jgi:ankyrin repeat protein